MMNKLTLKANSSKLKAEEGVAALPTMILIGGLATTIVIGLTSTAYIFVDSEFGLRLSSEAYAVARTGIQDAAMKIVRDKNFTSSLYTLPVGNYAADVTVCKDLPCVAVGKHKAVATGKAQSRRRNLQAIFNTDSATGKVRLESLKEVQL